MSIEASVREIGREEWAAATPIAARAFFDEEFIVGMLGPHPLRRWVDAHHFYAAEPFDDTAVHLGAFLRDVLVGVIRISPYGACFVCAHVDPTTPPDDEILARDWLFEVEAQKAHQGYADHAWISRVAVEPQLHGAGLGKLLLDSAVAHIERTGPGVVLLECLAQRESFYVGRGFRRAAEVHDAHADLSYLMRIDLPR
jgi:GNAT superfamily N-acetyltransferase